MLSKKESRNRLKDGIKNFYERLNIKLNKSQLDIVKNLNEKKIILCEHQLFFPHLGISRLPLMASSHFAKDEDSVVLFIANDIFYRRNHFTTRKLGIYCKGQNQDIQKNPIVMSCNKKHPLHLSPPPTLEQLNFLTQKVVTKYEINWSWYFEKNGKDLLNTNKNNYKNRIEFIFSIMKESLNFANTYSDWCIRFNIELLKLTNPKESSNILFFTHTGLLNSFDDIYNKIKLNSGKITDIINNQIFSQISENIPAYKSKKLPDDSLPFWFICPNCQDRNRALGLYPQFRFNCTRCKKSFNSESEIQISNYPDVITKQILGSFVFPELRVVGAIKPYSLISDMCFKELFNFTPSNRKVLDSKPRFFGLGTPSCGVDDATLLISLFEHQPEDLGKMLITKEWISNPQIKKDIRYN